MPSTFLRAKPEKSFERLRMAFIDKRPSKANFSLIQILADVERSQPLRATAIEESVLAVKKLIHIADWIGNYA